jgi:DNA-binding CsgD family transcriptional regulator
MHMPNGQRPRNRSGRGDGFAERYHLTPAEARVASLIASGHTGKEIAVVAAITQPTVRIHLRRVFAKTGTHRQVTLTSHTLGGARGLPVSDEKRGSATRFIFIIMRCAMLRVDNSSDKERVL